MWGSRDKMFFNHTVSLRYETTAEQLRFVLAGARTLLYQHARVESSTARVRLVRFAASGLDLELFAYVTSTEIEEFLAIQEDLLLRLMDTIEAAGTGLAFPSQTAYFARDAGIDREKAANAVAEVQVWRERGELPFPDVTPEVKNSLRGGIEYPPRGSVLRRGEDRA
jgi:MscS family membrane protein